MPPQGDEGSLRWWSLIHTMPTCIRIWARQCRSAIRVHGIIRSEVSYSHPVCRRLCEISWRPWSKRRLWIIQTPHYSKEIEINQIITSHEQILQTLHTVHCIDLYQSSRTITFNTHQQVRRASRWRAWQPPPPSWRAAPPPRARTPLRARSPSCGSRPGLKNTGKWIIWKADRWKQQTNYQATYQTTANNKINK